jgi:hypothetical protein
VIIRNCVDKANYGVVAKGIKARNQLNENNVVPAWIAGIQKPRMACAAHVHVVWIPAIHAGMTRS